MNKLRFYLLTIVALMCCMNSSAQVNEFEEGYLRYRIDHSKSETDATVTGHTDAMPADVVIPETVIYNGQTFNVTAIGSKAFTDCTALASIDFAKVKTIASEAFFCCTGLKSIDLKNVTTIAEGSFAGCSSLASIDFGMVEIIEDNISSDGAVVGAFSNCTALTSIDFKNVKTIGGYSFIGCTGLTSIDFGKVETIKDDAFFACRGLTSIDFKNVKTIGYASFEDCKGLKSINLKNAKTIEYSAFTGCEKITEVRTFETETPFVETQNAFETNVYALAKLYVPFGSEQKYASHEIWGKFKNIEEFDALGINDVTESAASVSATDGGIKIEGISAGTPVTIYTQNGAMTASAIASGTAMTIKVQPAQVYIVKAGSRTFKVIL